MDSNSVFAIIFPGQLPFSNFSLINDCLVYDLTNPGNYTTLTFYMMQPLPDGFGGALYYSTFPYENLNFIGAIGNNRPSDIFNTGFALNEDINQQQMIKLVIQVEKLENLKTLVELTDTNSLQKEYAKKVAQNLYNFILSYDQSNKNYNQGGGGGGIMTTQNNLMNNTFNSNNNMMMNMNNTPIQQNYLMIPQDFLEKWLNKFEQKYKMDPNFIQKTKSE